MMRAPVNKIIPFSNVDGPGNRTAIFFQGCPFDCAFCHNPETLHLCSGCGACLPLCPAGALTAGAGGVPEWDIEKCVGCDACIRACPHDASPRVRWMTVEAVMAQVRRSAPYIGGVTTSGGECTQWADFLIGLFTEVRKLGKGCLIDSNGSLDFETRPDLLEVCDGVMLDVKAVDVRWSERLTGQRGDLVLKNLDFLLGAGRLQEVRTVIFPGRDRDNEETVRYVARKIGAACDYKIIRYRPFGVRPRHRAWLGEATADAAYAEGWARLARELGAARAYVV
ncbi:MAG: YjjW family glycine radical enzyme activase [Clostridia bacterium]|nr:YjjW family glycine radical enzyme activase [Clostridia bacterium]